MRLNILLLIILIASSSSSSSSSSYSSSSPTPPLHKSTNSTLPLNTTKPPPLQHKRHPIRTKSQNLRLISELKTITETGHLYNYRTNRLIPSTLPNPNSKPRKLEYIISPLTPSLLKWRFTFPGPSNTSYTHGLYTGTLTLPPSYPSKPPLKIVINTPSSRFKVDHSICISASSFHPEMWDVRWGVESILIAFKEFVFAKQDLRGGVEIGGIYASDEVREVFAGRSRGWRGYGVDHGLILKSGVFGDGFLSEGNDCVTQTVKIVKKRKRKKERSAIQTLKSPNVIAKWFNKEINGLDNVFLLMVIGFGVLTILNSL